MARTPRKTSNKEGKRISPISNKLVSSATYYRHKAKIESNSPHKSVGRPSIICSACARVTGAQIATLADHGAGLTVGMCKELLQQRANACAECKGTQKYVCICKID